MGYRGEVLDHGQPFAEIRGGEPFPPLVTLEIHHNDGTSTEVSMDGPQARELSRHLNEAAVSIGPHLVTVK